MAWPRPRSGRRDSVWSVPEIRASAIGILIFRDHLLCFEGQDTVKGETYYRPLGGGIVFGERAADAVVREFREEIQRQVEVVEYLGTIENIFTSEGQPGHQIMAEFWVRFAPGEEPGDLRPLDAVESNGEEFLGHWLPLTAILDGAYTLYPDGLVERLAQWRAEGRIGN